MKKFYQIIVVVKLIEKFANHGTNIATRVSFAKFQYVGIPTRVTKIAVNLNRTCQFEFGIAKK